MSHFNSQVCLRAEQYAFVQDQAAKSALLHFVAVEKSSFSKHGCRPTKLTSMMHQRIALILFMRKRDALFGNPILSNHPM